MTLLNIDRITGLRNEIARRVGANRYRTWFGDQTDFAVSADALTIQVKNHFVATWIANKHIGYIESAAKFIFGEIAHLPVKIIAKESVSPPPVALPQPVSGVRPERPAPRAEGMPPQPQFVHLRGELKDFVVGKSNQLAHSAAVNMAEAVGRSFGLLLIYGGCGLGKTHLVQGICNQLRETRPGATWRFLSGEEFTNEYITAVKAGRTDAFRARYRNVDLLAIDDVHFLENKRATQDEFLHTYNAINASGKAVVLTSDRHPRNLATFSEPLINRLIAGMVVEIAPPDLETRREILQRRRALNGCDIDDVVLDYLARNITQNVRELEGALNKLAMVAGMLQQRISLDLARSLVQDLLRRNTAAPTCDEIVRHVAGHFGLTREQIHSRSRDRTIALARGLAIYIVRKHCAMSYPEMGRALGNKNHSTIVMAWQRIDGLCRSDAAVRWKNGGADHNAPVRPLVEQLEQGILAPRN